MKTIDDLARHAAVELREHVSAHTDVDAGLERIESENRSAPFTEHRLRARSWVALTAVAARTV